MKRIGIAFIVAMLVQLMLVPFIANAQAAAVAFCDVSGVRYDLIQEFGRRIAFDENSLSKLKIFGGKCEVHLPEKSDVLLNSVRGTIFVDGVQRDGGNGLVFQATAIGIDYAAGDTSAGFDMVWSPLGQTTTTTTATTSSGDIPELPAGSCTPKGGQQVNLTWAPDKNRLFLTEADYNSLKGQNNLVSVDCHVQAGKNGGTVNAIGQQFSLAPGEHWTYTFPEDDPSFGFDFVAN